MKRQFLGVLIILVRSVAFKKRTVRANLETFFGVFFYFNSKVHGTANLFLAGYTIWLQTCCYLWRAVIKQNVYLMNYSYEVVNENFRDKLIPFLKRICCM